MKPCNLTFDVGARGNAQLDAAVEVTWAPSHLRTGDDVRVTYLMGVGQYRPLKNHGFFVKGGMGVAFVRNWVFDATNDVTPAFTTNAMALTYGAGWEVRSRGRFGLQVRHPPCRGPRRPDGRRRRERRGHHRHRTFGARS